MTTYRVVDGVPLRRAPCRGRADNGVEQGVDELGRSVSPEIPIQGRLEGVGVDGAGDAAADAGAEDGEADDEGGDLGHLAVRHDDLGGHEDGQVHEAGAQALDDLDGEDLGDGVLGAAQPEHDAVADEADGGARDEQPLVAPRVGHGEPAGHGRQALHDAVGVLEEGGVAGRQAAGHRGPRVEVRVRAGEADRVAGDEEEAEGDGPVAEVVRRQDRVPRGQRLVEGQGGEDEDPEDDDEDDDDGEEEKEEEEEGEEEEEMFAARVRGIKTMAKPAHSRRVPPRSIWEQKPWSVVFFPAVVQTVVLGPPLVVEQGGDDDGGAGGHEDGEHADAPAPADAAGPDDVVDDEAGGPGGDEEGEEEEADGEAAPAGGGDVGDDDVVHDVGGGLADGVQDGAGGVGVEGGGGGHEDVARDVKGHGHEVGLAAADDVGQLGDERLDDGEDDGRRGAQRRQPGERREGRRGVVVVDADGGVFDLAVYRSTGQRVNGSEHGRNGLRCLDFANTGLDDLGVGGLSQIGMLVMLVECVECVECVKLVVKLLAGQLDIPGVPGQGDTVVVYRCGVSV
ncbi:hypothetical protein CTA1_235 [Colletotrichum tanaceti]|uniref:Uncharacterized protein n=1 Tax=Colletotrichum tanaceti TaxID=1306861 RepID=A0A4U6X3K8_9PEZI|nr:hypothetical protein CTA1_235 [Colletotrichum tanaceti]